MTAERGSRDALSVQRADSFAWADERDRPDAAEVRLRQVYAELGGMIRGSHKSERRMLLRKIMNNAEVHDPRWLKTVLNFACVEAGAGEVN
jgi:hypothetical protein